MVYKLKLYKASFKNSALYSSPPGNFLRKLHSNSKEKGIIHSLITNLFINKYLWIPMEGQVQ